MWLIGIQWASKVIMAAKKNATDKAATAQMNLFSRKPFLSHTLAAIFHTSGDTNVKRKKNTTIQPFKLHTAAA